MHETTPEFHHLEYALASAREIIADLPDHDIRNELDELKLRSYVLLQHAAVEEYLEKTSLYALKECAKAFDQRKVITEPLIAACAHYSIDSLDHFTSLTNSHLASDFFSSIIHKAIQAHSNALDGVHGIKTKDQDAIFNPIGLRLHDFDHVLSQKLNSIGATRGNVAHLFRIRVKRPKIGHLSETGTLIQLLREFDNEVCRRIRIAYQAS